MIEDELRPVASVFADVVGSTSLGERLTPPEVKALIGECVTRMCEAVEAFGGHVGSYMGDGIAAFFGIERARADDSERAVRAALEIRRVVSEYSREVEAAWGISDFDVRVGANVGRVAVGWVGANNPQRVALGDSVNVAARLQSAAGPGGVLLGEAIAVDVADRFVCRPVGELAVKGRDAFVKAFEIASSESNEQPGLCSRLVGRQSELADLNERLVELCNGRGQFVTLSGEGGIGKSRLVTELKRSASAEVLWLEGFCEAMDARLPHEPFAQALRSWLGISRRSSEIEARLRLRARGSEILGSRFDECAPFLARLMGIGLATKLDRRLEGLPADALVSGLRSAIVEWVHRLALQAPVVLAIDNLDSATQSTVELLCALLALIETAPLMILVTTRPAASSSAVLLSEALMAYESRVGAIRLPPLGMIESSDLVSELDQRERLNDRLRRLVVERAEGNPLYIEELVAALSVGSDEAAPGIPASLERLLLARLDSLTPPARRAAQAAAVLGRTFPHEVLIRTVGGSEPEQAISELLRSDIVREQTRTPRGYAFRHGLLRDAALATLTPRTRERLHARAAVAIEAWPAFDAERDTAALVEHYAAAGRMEEAQGHVARLADQFVRVGQWEHAATLIDDCWAHVGLSERSADLGLRLAEIRSAQGRIDDAIAVLEHILKLADGVLVEAIVIAWVRCLHDGGRIDDVGALLDTVDPNTWSAPGRGRLVILRGELALGTGDVEEAARCIRDLELHGEIPVEIEFEAASLRAGVALASGDTSTAERWALEAQHVAERSGQLYWQLLARRHVAMVALGKGCVEEAHHLVQSLYDQYANLGLVTGQLYSALMGMHTSHLLGQLDEGALIGEELLSGEFGPVWRAMAAANQATIRAEQGRFDEAMELLTELEGVNDGIPPWVHLAAAAVRAGHAEAQDDLEMAREILISTLNEAGEANWGPDHATLMVSLADLSLTLEDRDSALFWSERAWHCVAAAQPWTRLDAERCRLRSRAAIDGGDTIRSLEQVRAAFRRMGVKLSEARTLVSLAAVDNDPIRREHNLADAECIFTACGALSGARAVEAFRHSLNGSISTRVSGDNVASAPA